MIYISPNGDFPKYISDVMAADPSWKVGDTLPEGWHEVTQTPPPQLLDDERIESSEAVLVNGVYEIKWTTRKATAEEISIANAPATAKEKLIALGFTNDEIKAIAAGLIA